MSLRLAVLLLGPYEPQAPDIMGEERGGVSYSLRLIVLLLWMYDPQASDIMGELCQS